MLLITLDTGPGCTATQFAQKTTEDDGDYYSLYRRVFRLEVDGSFVA